MSLADNVVTVQISAATKGPTRVGFGTPLLLAYHTVTPNEVASYDSLTDITNDGFPITHPVYRMAEKAFSQNPAPESVIVGKRLIGTTQVITITPINLTAGYTYVFSVFDYLGVETDISYTVLPSATATSISTALAALLTIASVTTTSAAFVTLTSTAAGRLFNLTNLPNPSNLKIANTSADPGIAADLAAVAAVDNLSWYGVALDSNSKAEVVAAAAWIEANYRKLMLVNSTDSACVDNTSTTDVMAVLKAASYSRSAVLFSQTELLSYSALAWMANRFPYNPGKPTYDLVTLPGVTVDNLTDGQVTNIVAKNGNVYVVIAGNGATNPGQDAEGEWIDTVTGTDWLQARMQERVLGAMTAASNSGTKIPFTDSGVQQIVGLVYAQLAEAQSPAFGLLATSPAPVVSAPLVANVDPSDKQNRTLPNVTFTAEYAGAIQAVAISGTISV